MNVETSSTMMIRRYKVMLRSVALVLGAAQVVLDRNGFGPDAQSYSEIARAYLRHDWAMTINAHWGPLYSWLIALTLQLGKPSLRWEFPLLHLLRGRARSRLFNEIRDVPHGFGFPRRHTLLPTQLAKCRQRWARTADLCEHCRPADNCAVKSQRESYILG